MDILYLAVILLCRRYGEVEGLLPIARDIGMDPSLAARRLRWIEERDNHMHIIRRGKGRPIKIFYDFTDNHIPSIRWKTTINSVGVITLPEN